MGKTTGRRVRNRSSGPGSPALPLAVGWPLRSFAFRGYRVGSLVGNRVTSAGSHLRSPCFLGAPRTGVCGAGGCLSPHGRGLADFLLGGCCPHRGLVDPWEPGSLRAPGGREGPRFPPGQARSSSLGWRGRLLIAGWGPGKEDGAELGEGGRQAWQLRDGVGGAAFCVSPSRGKNPQPEGGWGPEGTVRAAGTGQDPGRRFLHSSLFQRLLSDPLLP